MWTVRVRATTEDEVHEGFSAELLVPKWFSKDPDTSFEDDRRDLILAARRAFDAMTTGGPATVFELWLRAQHACVEAVEVPASRKLVAMFGVSLIERALLDVVCRASNSSFDAALRDNLFGIDMGLVEPRLADWTAERLGVPSDSVKLRHTVGLADDLDASDLFATKLRDDARRRPADDFEVETSDGHPVTLVEDIEAYGLSCFKLKVSGDAAADRSRLEHIADLTPDGSTFTLDGNEQYRDPAGLAATLSDLRAAGTAPRLIDGLIAFEQAVPRAHSFDAATREGVARLAEFAPVMIDEADADLDAFPRALGLGYMGVSMKACKGVLRALVNRARIDIDGRGFQSAEDLTNLPALPLHQDLAVVRALGLPHVERNGHHYFRGQGHLERHEREHLVREHASLYLPDGRLRIHQGELELSSLGAPGFGYAGPVSLATLAAEAVLPGLHDEEPNTP